MKVLEKLRIPSESDEDYGEEYESNSLDELQSELSSRDEVPALDDPRRDPAPGEAPPRKTAAKDPPRRVRGDVPRITKKHREDAQEEVETFLNVLALTWGLQAPPCGEALEEATPEIAAKLVKILARNPRWLLKVREGGILADALSLCLTLRPVVMTAWGYYTQPKGGDETGGVPFDPAAFQPYQP